ncbi:MAG: YciI family protein [Segniliparus sp.]|uniref:YciI family protein n=1 Tax=Segniliparus sp. TaxID=2804064 RepID=UPI003F309750
MKQYLLAVHGCNDAPLPSPEEMEKFFGQVDKLNKKLQEQGAWVFAGGLESVETATVVRNEAGKTTITDGPYAEAKEFLGGFWIIRAQDLDAALQWAGEASAACGNAVEVRPFQDEPQQD